MANDRDSTELQAISDIERACSVLSLLGCLFVIITFCCFSGFQKPVNRLVFYATFGNMMTNIGTLMSRSYVDSPDSVGCQFQSFLIQMFMPADAFWTFAMALNIYLTFYHRFDANRLAKMEIPYLVSCFGVPFVPALVFVFLRNDSGQRVYGDARLWCWVSTEWHILRIAAFYAPVWILILATVLIYIRAGSTIYQKRRELLAVPDPGPLSSTVDTENIKTTEITVTTQISTNGAERVTNQLQSLGIHGIYNPSDGYSVSISADDNTSSGRVSDGGGGRRTNITTGTNYRRKQKSDFNSAAWSYTKCAILFFTALLVTWIPSSANRVYAFVHNNDSVRALEFMSAFVLPLQGFWNAIIYAVTSWAECKDAWSRIRSGVGRLVDRLLLGRVGRPQNDTVGTHHHHHHRGFRLSSSPPRRITHGVHESESMTELAMPDTARTTVTRRDT